MQKLAEKMRALSEKALVANCQAQEETTLDRVRRSSAWLLDQEEMAANAILMAGQTLQAAAQAGRTNIWVMDVNPAQYDCPRGQIAYPVTCENSDAFFGAAKYVVEWLLGEDFEVFLHHSGTVNGISQYKLVAGWGE